MNSIRYFPRTLTREQLDQIATQCREMISVQLVRAALDRGDVIGVYCTPAEGWVFAFRRATYSEEFGSPREFSDTYDGFPLIAVYKP